MPVKVALMLAFVAQVAAALLALRLNFRYRIYSAWFLVSAAASAGAILRLTSLVEIWGESPTIQGQWSLWITAVASLFVSVLLVGGMALIEPFFQQIARAEETLRREHHQLTSMVKETEDELRLAQRIQRQLLPTNAPHLPQMDVYGASEPAEWTGGDYFDYLELCGGATAIVVADVSGHGLGPALLMSSTRASFRALAPTVSEVGELLTCGNRAVVDAVSRTEFVTACVVRYDLNCRALFYATAGHAAYLLKGDGSSLVLAGKAPPLGILPDLVVTTDQHVGIEPGDVLILVTDGILETHNATNEMFGETRLFDIAAKHRQHKAKEVVTALFDASRVFADGQPQQDDNTAVVIKFT
jgi:sigma-B regulation protein RsbU (phosphoserine phosphatase)